MTERTTIKQACKGLFDKWILTGLIINIALKVLWFCSIASRQELYGDEVQYNKIAVLLPQLFNGDDSVATQIAGFVHRMPGMSVLILLFHQINDSVATVRLGLSVVDTLLFVVVIVLILYSKGIRIGRTFVFIVACSPILINFSFCAWGDLIAGWLAAIVTLVAYSFRHNYMPWKKQLWAYFVIGGLVGVSTCFRPNMMIFAPLIVLAMMMDSIRRKEWTVYVLLKRTTVAAIIVVIGSLTILGPWMLYSSYVQKRVIIEPAQLVREDQWLKWRVWAYSPVDFGYFYRRSDRFNAAFYNPSLKELNPVNETLSAMYRDVIRHSTPLTFIKAWSRNINNIIANENQYIASSFRAAGVKGAYAAGMPHVKNFYTYGGCKLKKTYSVASKFLRGCLLFNSYLYYSVIMLVITWLIISGGILRKGYSWMYLFFANVIAIFSMSFYHPGHGRYILSLLPVLIITASKGIHDFVFLVSQARTDGKTAFFSMETILLCIFFFLGLTVYVFTF